MNWRHAPTANQVEVAIEPIRRQGSRTSSPLELSPSTLRAATGARRRKANFRSPSTNMFSRESAGAESPRYRGDIPEFQPKGE